MKFMVLAILLVFSSYVNSPAHVPNFDNFTTPVLEPGKSGAFNFTIENRYVNTMNNTVLHIEIYMWATEEGSKKIENIENAPVIEESGNFRYSLSLGAIRHGEKKPVLFHIRTFGNTPDGVYFVRFSLFFNYNGTIYKMWSPGYFSRSDWDNATKNHTLNLDYLSSVLGDRVDGIVPDSSFTVKSSWLWVLYILIGITVLVGIAALYLFLREENRVTKGDEYIYQLKGKYKTLEEELKEKMKRIKGQKP